LKANDRTSQCSDGESFIYLVQAGNRLKIGIARDIGKRISGMQSGNPEIIRLIGAFHGGRAEEQALHTQLSAYKIRGEWFEPHPDVLTAFNPQLIQ
jgi:hypothetical protein